MLIVPGDKTIPGNGPELEVMVNNERNIAALLKKRGMKTHFSLSYDYFNFHYQVQSIIISVSDSNTIHDHGQTPKDIGEQYNTILYFEITSTDATSAVIKKKETQRSTLY